MKKNLTLLFYDFEEFHFGKDVFLVPYYLGILYDYSVTIVYPQKNPDQVFPAFYKNVRLLPVKCYGDKNNINIKDLNLAIYLLKHAKEIDCLMRFHNTPMTALIVILYKLLNPKGYAYVKMDINPYEIENSTTKHDKLYRCLYSKYIQRLDLVSCETTEAFQKLPKSQSFFFNFKDKLILMPNGFDEQSLKELNIKELSFSEKKNMIITVGRLGTAQKNTEMFLKALEKTDLKDWTVCMIGPIENHFQLYIDQFFEKYPHKKKNILFTGAIYDKKTLWEYYNQAKVFVLTSDFESYALVLNEAKRFKNYIISTPVGACLDLIENNKYGTTVGINDHKELADKLQQIIYGNANINVYDNYDSHQLSWEYIIKHIPFDKGHISK